jgi:AcrR family transcriptional regulator
MAEWGVSMHIAFKALRQLQDEGLTTKIRGTHGMVVTEDADEIAFAWEPPPPPRLEVQARVVRIAIELADAGGLAGVSMRLIAERMGTATMTPYRYVRPRSRLDILMADAVFAEHPPPAGGGDWRAALEALGRLHWTMYRRRPWLAEALSFTDPELSPHVIAHAEWAGGTLVAAGLDAETAARAAATLADLVRGSALDGPAGGDDEAFEFSLGRLLDGFAQLLP